MPWTSGQVLTAALLNTYLPQNWATFAPNFPNLPVSGNTGQFTIIGKTVHFRATATVTGAAGPWWMDLPVQAAQSSNIINSTVWAVDQGTGFHVGIATLRNATSIQCLSVSPATGSVWAATVPFTWANTDSITIAGTYQAA